MTRSWLVIEMDSRDPDFQIQWQFAERMLAAHREMAAERYSADLNGESL